MRAWSAKCEIRALCPDEERITRTDEQIPSPARTAPGIATVSNEPAATRDVTGAWMTNMG
ncbi:hypothetical protein [Brachybacterium sacelli]|uniref:hypothetical protein n=1 Tax=Brachybacterium sacelli TaxID=173364 RepID=UPI0036108DCB